MTCHNTARELMSLTPTLHPPARLAVPSTVCHLAASSHRRKGCGQVQVQGAVQPWPWRMRHSRVKQGSAGQIRVEFAQLSARDRGKVHEIRPSFPSKEPPHAIGKTHVHPLTHHFAQDCHDADGLHARLHLLTLSHDCTWPPTASTYHKHSPTCS
jgi:hypothetical protein